MPFIKTRVSSNKNIPISTCRHRFYCTPWRVYQETIEMFRLKYFLLSVDHILWQLPGLIHQVIFNYSLIAQHEEHAQRGTGQYETKSLSTRLWILLWFFFFFFFVAEVLEHPKLTLNHFNEIAFDIYIIFTTLILFSYGGPVIF